MNNNLQSIQGLCLALLTHVTCVYSMFFFCINLLNVWLWTKFPCAMDFLSFNEMILLMLEMSAFAVSTISKEKT